MKCHYCGQEVTEGNRYCLFCGTRQEPEEAVRAESDVLKDTWKGEPAEPEKKVLPMEPVLPAAQPESPAAPPASARPAQNRIYTRLQLPTCRGLGKMFFLGILTLGIYPTVIWSRIVTELNLAACRYDGKRTMPFFAMLMLSGITLGIFPLVWMHKFCNRIGAELGRRRIDYKFGASTFWLWNVLGSLILVGPFIFTHKLMKSMNQINADFNRRA